MSALDLEVGNALAGMSGRKRGLWWDAGYDTGCASWSRLGVWGRASWVEWLDMARVCGLGNREEGSWLKPRDHVQCTQ